MVLSMVYGWSRRWAGGWDTAMTRAWMRGVWHVRVVAAEMARTQKNKATSFHLGVLKAKLAKLKRELIEPKGSGGGAKPGEGFDVTKSGDARVGLIGTLAT